jgi:hypothetical protein
VAESDSELDETVQTCEVCGDDADFVERCNTCDWLFCESCAGDEGNCEECWHEIQIERQDESGEWG